VPNRIYYFEELQTARLTIQLSYYINNTYVTHYKRLKNGRNKNINTG